MWIARDKNNDLYAYSNRPVKENTFFEGGDFLELDSNEFPEITWENSPVEIQHYEF